MRKVVPILILRLALLVAVLGCAVLLVEYENMGDPAFCGAGSGCMAVRHSPYSVIAGVHLPLLGLCAELPLFVLALVAREREHTFFVAAAAGAGALVSLGLIGIMALKIGAICKWCLLVDGCTIVAAAAAVWVHVGVVRDPSFEPYLLALSRRRGQIVAWIGGAAIVAGLPFVWSEYPVVPPPPRAIAELAVPGKVTIVTFTDFECPFCRKLAPVLHEVQDNWGDRAVVVRKMVPLGFHPGAMPAALAWVCTPAEQRDEMADRLYAAPSLSKESVQVLAQKLHLDEARFARCLEAPETRAAVEADQKLFFDELDLHGLPHTYVGKRAVSGFNPEALRNLGREAMDGDRPGLPLWGMVAGAMALAAALALFTLRLSPAEDAGSPAPAGPGGP